MSYDAKSAKSSVKAHESEIFIPFHMEIYLARLKVGLTPGDLGIVKSSAYGFVGAIYLWVDPVSQLDIPSHYYSYNLLGGK